jgi:hypothetical protein
VSRVETLFGELEYLESRLKALGVVEVHDTMAYVVDHVESDDV